MILLYRELCYDGTMLGWNYVMMELCCDGTML